MALQLGLFIAAVGDGVDRDAPGLDRDFGARQTFHRCESKAQCVFPAGGRGVICRFDQVGDRCCARDGADTVQHLIMIGCGWHEADNRKARVVAQYLCRKARGCQGCRRLDLHIVNHAGRVHDPTCGGQRRKPDRLGRRNACQRDLQPVCLHFGPGHATRVQRGAHAKFRGFLDQLDRKVGGHQCQHGGASKSGGNRKNRRQAHERPFVSCSSERV
mmetsp:Transcript_23807/g.42915  ORF Transcript_23807/g.42915 Transcript_23807/m.42915 type:complete len:216 (+) Transcript_23807:1670-2317(+)